MNREEALEYCNQAIKALKFRARIYPYDNIQAVVAVAIGKIESLKADVPEIEEDLFRQIRSIWAPVSAATSAAKIKKEPKEAPPVTEQSKKLTVRNPMQKDCSVCDHGCFARTPFGCQFKCGEPPYCAGFVWDKKGEIFNV